MNTIGRSDNEYTCAICYSDTRERSELEYGHAFGRTCMADAINSGNEAKCFLCMNRLTDEEIRNVKAPPQLSLYQRVIAFCKDSDRRSEVLRNNLEEFVLRPVPRAIANLCVKTGNKVSDWAHINIWKHTPNITKHLYNYFQSKDFDSEFNDLVKHKEYLLRHNIKEMSRSEQSALLNEVQTLIEDIHSLQTQYSCANPAVLYEVYQNPNFDPGFLPLLKELEEIRRLIIVNIWKLDN